MKTGIMLSQVKDQVKPEEKPGTDPSLWPSWYLFFGFQSPELWDNIFMLFNPFRLWYFVTALVHKYSEFTNLTLLVLCSWNVGPMLCIQEVDPSELSSIRHVLWFGFWETRVCTRASIQLFAEQPLVCLLNVGLQD